VTGTAVAPVQYDYGVEEESPLTGPWWQYLRETKLDSSWQTTSEWTQTYQDGAGRTFKTLYAPRPDVTGETPYQQYFYNTKGQLWKVVDPDGVTTLYAYNAKGEQEYTILAVTSNARQISYGDLCTELAAGTFQGGADRITQVERSVQAADSNSGRPGRLQVDTYAWVGTAETPTQKHISRVETSTDGLRSWQTVWRDASNEAVTSSQTTLTPSTGARVVTVTAPDSTATVSTYLYGLLQSVVRHDSRNATISSISYAYDKYDRPTTSTDLRNGTTTNVLNNADLVTSTISPDPSFQRAREQPPPTPDLMVPARNLNAAPAMASPPSPPSPPPLGPGQQVTTTFYDNMGRVTGKREPDATTITNFYKPTGSLFRTSGSRTYPVEYGYDAQGRMTTMKTWQSFQGFTSGGGTATTSWNYDVARGWLKSKDYPDPGDGTPGSAGPKYEYTPGGRLRSRTWVRPGTTSGGILTAYSYGFDQSAGNNYHGDLAEISYPNDPASTPSVSFTYDRQGRRSTVAQAGITTSLGYDDADEPTSESYTTSAGYGGSPLAGLSVDRTYNNQLQLSSLSLGGANGSYSATYGYLWGRLGFILQAGKRAMYSYVDNSPLVSQIEFGPPSGPARMTTTKQYDFLNRLLSISSTPAGDPTLSFGYRYNLANQRTALTLADGSYWSYGYDGLGQVISGKRFWVDGTRVAGQQYEYTFDTIGSRKTASMGGDASGGPLRQALYTPNLLNQYDQRDMPQNAGAGNYWHVDIMGIANPNADVTVTADGTSYSPNSRRGEYFDFVLPTPNYNAAWYQTVSIQSSYGGNSQIQSGKLFVPQTPEYFLYDDDGNLKQDGCWAYTWDAENRLVGVAPASTSSGPQQTLSFEYDWQGRRIRKQVWSNGNLISDLRFVYDGWNLIAVLDAQSSILESFVWGLDMSGSLDGAGGVGGLLMATYNGPQTASCFVAYDGNGNVSGLVDASSGHILAQYEYGPFGEVIRATGPMARANPFRFSTKYQDDETDLLYYGYRYYCQSTGRWINRDPLAERGGLNLYVFTENNPCGLVDPVGLGTQPSGPNKGFPDGCPNGQHCEPLSSCYNDAMGGWHCGGNCVPDPPPTKPKPPTTPPPRPPTPTPPTPRPFGTTYHKEYDDGNGKHCNDMCYCKNEVYQEIQTSPNSIAWNQLVLIDATFLNPDGCKCNYMVKSGPDAGTAISLNGRYSHICNLHYCY
jgi:RHS repeat-associated protein